MSITVEETGTGTEVFAITEAKPLGEHRLRLTFDDGVVKVVDFGPFLRASRNPSVRAYLEQGKFEDFTIEDGFLHWHDFNLVFPMADLRAGLVS